jgi:hypothetical protein
MAYLHGTNMSLTQETSSEVNAILEHVINDFMLQIVLCFCLFMFFTSFYKDNLFIYGCRRIVFTLFVLFLGFILGYSRASIVIFKHLFFYQVLLFYILWAFFVASFLNTGFYNFLY